MITNLGIG